MALRPTAENEPPKCPHNDGVVCSGFGTCEGCGWDPEVARARLEKFCKERRIQLPQEEPQEEPQEVEE